MAVEHAHRILDLQENLNRKEMPPRWMWPLDDEMGKWLDDVWDARGGNRDDDDKSSPNSGRERADMMENEHAERFRKN